MTLEEEIMKLDLIASDAFEGGDANEFMQLAEWLKELKAYREAKCEISDMADWHMNNGQEDIAMVISLDALAIISKHIEEVNADDDSD